MIKKHNVVMMTGGSSSAVAIAQSDVCQKHGIVFMAALTHSNATTGHMHRGKWSAVQKAHRHTFRWYFNAWMTSEALTPFVIKKFGSTAKYYYITADYTWGHTLEESMRRGTELAGAETLGAILTPLGSKDYTEHLASAKESGAEVLVLVLFGQDMVNALKQAADMGLKDKMKIVVPLMELNMARGAGPKAIEGVIATKNWYWGLKDKFPGSKEFVDAFFEAYNRAPGSSAAAAWTAIHEWASAAKRAGGFSADGVIKALEGHNFVLLKDEEEWRSWDHQAISSVYVVRGKKNAESKGLWDLLEIVDEFKGADVVRTREENPVSLEKLPSEQL
jgi:ABC-type branched-subunit amino acid transport system substrate-binding protein